MMKSILEGFNYPKIFTGGIYSSRTLKPVKKICNLPFGWILYHVVKPKRLFGELYDSVKMRQLEVLCNVTYEDLMEDEDCDWEMEPIIMYSCRSKIDDGYIGTPEDTWSYFKDFGLSQIQKGDPEDNVCSIGFNEKEREWHGKTKKWWKGEEGKIELKKLFDDGLTIRGIAKICELKPTFVRNQLIRIGCNTSPEARNRIYSKQKKGANFFDEIDNEEKAYWLGFIWADGNIRQDYHTLRINLAEVDSSHLEKLTSVFKTEVKFNSSVKNDKVLKGAYVAVNNTHLCLTLAEKGIVPNKTEEDSADVFNYVPKNLLKHFVRGFFDGDGTNNPSYISFVGGERFLSKLREVIIEESNVHTDGSLYEDGSIFRLSWNGTNVTNIIRSWMSKNATIYLERKWIGFYGRWYGWSHRAMRAFGIGDIVKEGDCTNSSGYTDEYLKEHPEKDISLPVGFRAKTLDDAKTMAIVFADSIS